MVAVAFDDAEEHEFDYSMGSCVAGDNLMAALLLLTLECATCPVLPHVFVFTSSLYYSVFQCQFFRLE
jgi:hypothetical protein